MPLWRLTLPMLALLLSPAFLASPLPAAAQTSVPMADAPASPTQPSQAPAPVDLSHPFDASAFTADELEFLQRALIFTGDYTGVADGQWRIDSDDALIGYVARQFGSVKPTLRDAGVLAERFSAEVARNDWVNLYAPDIDLSFTYPRALVTQDDTGGGYDDHLAHDRVFFRIIRTDRQATLDMHAALQAGIDRSDLHGHRETDRSASTNGYLPGGRWAYLNSTFGTPLDTSVVIRAAPGDLTRARLIASAARPGRHAAPQIHPGSLLDRILAAHPDLSDARYSVPSPRRVDDPAAPVDQPL
ncbi:hypothetical protein DL237_11690 [Pseudooceanicola sediminis]|uniref:Uncharacterized protein n=1 Tax=Pseudooceanicola sediminis TaxID=2211117 RepID=A0A399J1M4_9RHOB|nr:hypothetical protein [Pseudooceanicola sediminis]KAA2313630.1 hypothetical protein E0K93_13345 [Puniceibacterium sp. HSS470]RII38527.1 hypothetical protein DL237_11690 [Pseudooceanicola sediminis]